MSAPCKDDSCDAVHCPKCGGHKLDWYADGLCSDCHEKENQPVAKPVIGAVDCCPFCGYPYFDCTCHPQWMS